MAQSPFEIPQPLRELTEKNIEQARAAYGQFMDAMTQAMGMWSKAMPGNAMTTGFEAVQKKAVKFAKQNAEAGFQLANEIARQGNSGRARTSEPLRADPDAELRPSGARAWTLNGGGSSKQNHVILMRKPSRSCDPDGG